MKYEISLATPDQPTVIQLLELSDAYYAELYPAESNHLLDVDALMNDNTHFFVARDIEDARIVGCAALVSYSDYGEIKRMFVLPETRGTGAGRDLLCVLEQAARQFKLPFLRLETGTAQPEAIGLYKAEGYKEIEPFGDYKRDPLSLFMEKELEAV
ncbi:GNAT family N-acetyltransferase [Terasakiella sp. SH-1]|uniref:GNAT family N-acetyltransferase n=1 Tax=Terasakiella sp. SH-1 TaxID=2560057 RepID=UPI00107321D4|nr:GNAT family N-acetyltransferase [Terasakiella sp. SH-1]